MSGEGHKEDEFTGKIDTLLSGKESKNNIIAEDKEYGSELDFAVKIKENRAEPSELFKSQLRVKLLQKLAANETKPLFRQWLWSVFTSPVLRQAAVPVAIFVLAIVTMWGLGVFSSQPTRNVTNQPGTSEPGIMGTLPTSTAYLDISAGTQKVSFSSGQEIKLDITLRNNTEETVNIGLFPPETSLVKQNNPAEIIRSFKAGKAILKLQPQEIGTYTLTWDQLDDYGIQVIPGTYEIRLNLSIFPENVAVDKSRLPVITIASR
jgi:hypothetical protein